MRDDRPKMMYCSVCKQTTYWEMIDGSHWCVGSDRSRPERRLHGPRESGRKTAACKVEKDGNVP